MSRRGGRERRARELRRTTVYNPNQRADEVERQAAWERRVEARRLLGASSSGIAQCQHNVAFIACTLCSKPRQR